MLRKSSSQKPKNTPFRQQKLKAWQPILTPRIIIPCSFIFGFFFLLIGILLVVSVNSVVEFSKRYDNLCAEGANCTITIDISKKMKHPVYFYYELTNFYQNHRRYVKSRCDEQLRGQSVTYNDMKDCKPKRSRNDKDNPDDFYLPCGLIAASNFNDTFTIKNQASEVVGFDSSGIAWKSDLEKKFKNPDPWPVGIVVESDYQDPHFVVWMRTAALPTFTKLYASYDQDLEPGTYSIDIENRYSTEFFEGQKSIIFSTSCWIGGKNNFLAYSYIVCGIILIIFASLFLIKHLTSRKILSEHTIFNWEK